MQRVALAAQEHRTGLLIQPGLHRDGRRDDMPLTRATVTVASRIMLPTYVAATTATGLIYTLDPGHRLVGSHALTYQRAVMHGSLVPWGCIFLAVGVVMLAAFIARDRMLACVALAVCAASQGAWAALYTVSAILDPLASYTPIVYSGLFATACVASMLSLLHGETQ